MTEIGNGRTLDVNVRSVLTIPIPIPFAPTVSASTGVIGSLGAAAGTVRYHGGMMYLSYDVRILTKGTANDSIQLTMPKAAGELAIVSGRQNAPAGTGLIAQAQPGSNILAVRTVSNAYPGGDGWQLIVSGWVPYQS